MSELDSDLESDPDLDFDDEAEDEPLPLGEERLEDLDGDDYDDV